MEPQCGDCQNISGSEPLERTYGICMTELEYSRKVEELDRLLNDPSVPMQADRIWTLLADMAKRAGRLPNPAPAGGSA